MNRLSSIRRYDIEPGSIIGDPSEEIIGAEAEEELSNGKGPDEA